DTVAITGDVRGLTRRWRRRVDEPSPEQTSNASFTAPVKRDLVDRVLAARGITGDAVEPFLNPSLHALHDPALLPGAEVAAERILSAAAAREPIVIYGDYDVDGVTATAILVRTLRAIDPEAAVSTYVPHRVDEGYGLNVPAIRSLADSGARVIVSVDCGVTAVEPARVARELGVDLIITDHHNPPASAKDLPEATAIVHPSLPGTDQQYPFAELCGAGVAYKLAWRMASIASGDGDRVRPDLRVLLVELLAFAALGTIADVVPLEGENRVLARFGLARCKHTPFTGLRALVEACGLAGENIDAMGVGFKLAPRLNACGRLGTAQDAIDLFLTSDPEAAARIADDLNTQNNERRQTATRILDEALELAVSHGMDKPDQRAVVLADPGWHPGVVGIVCSRLVERLCRPVVLLQSRDDDELGAICAGSGRSITGFNLHAALAACSEHLMTFGGHDAAAGLKLKHDNLDAFREAFVAHANERLTPDDLVAHAAYDTDATIEELSVESVGALERMGPFGRGNPGV
ncbi:MAG: single-stranded-DNA-specific exonuclease RecJ, partial [Planctomycetota bacterium]